MLKSKTRS